jgi:hypothetical protein
VREPVHDAGVLRAAARHWASSQPERAMLRRDDRLRDPLDDGSLVVAIRQAVAA